MTGKQQLQQACEKREITFKEHLHMARLTEEELDPKNNDAIVYDTT